MGFDFEIFSRNPRPVPRVLTGQIFQHCGSHTLMICNPKRSVFPKLQSILPLVPDVYDNDIMMHMIPCACTLYNLHVTLVLYMYMYDLFHKLLTTCVRVSPTSKMYTPIAYDLGNS